MHVALINTHYTPDLVGGAERSLQVLAHGLRDAGERVTVICLATSTKPGQAEHDRVDVVYLPSPELSWSMAPDQRFPWRSLPGWSKPFWHLRETWNRQLPARLHETLQRLQPDLVHTNNLLGFSAGSWGVVKQLGLPLVHTLRDYQLLCPRGQMMKAGRRCDQQCLSCRAYSKSRIAPSQQVDAVVGNSRFILERHTDNGFFAGASKARVIYNAWSASDDDPDSVGEKNAAVLRVGFMGNLHPAKGLHRMLASLQPLLSSGRLLVRVAGSGEGPFVDALREQYTENVEFLGWTPSASLLGSIDLLVIPSLWEEPLSRTLFEAFKKGVPVLASRRGGHPEVVRDGIDGYCYEPEQERELLQQVQRFIEQPDQLVNLSAGAKAAAERFSPQRLVAGYQSLYAGVLEMGSSSGAGGDSNSS